MDDVEAIGLLQDPVRRRLYEAVVAHGGEVTRAEVASATDVARNLVGFHLDKLVGAGLLEVDERRVNGRTGPGAGRPAKVYRRTSVERTLSLPARDYRLAAEVLADAAEEVRLDEALEAAARRRGLALRVDGEAGSVEQLRALGYEPYDDGDGVTRLANCPFHAVAEAHPGLVCGMNLALLEGMLGDVPGVDVVLDARPDIGCCVALVPKGRSKNNHD
ncbi:MAG: helix-turn-helix transcriptional regulator [Acidimicrobiales bacterium]